MNVRRESIILYIPEIPKYYSRKTNSHLHFFFFLLGQDLLCIKKLKQVTPTKSRRDAVISTRQLIVKLNLGVF